MATGWAGDNAVQDQIDATIKDAIKRARSQLPTGPGLTHCEDCDAEIPEARLRLVGEGPEGSVVKRLTHELGLAGAVERVGWLDPPAVEQELERAWALVAPSLYAEPLGLVALEAIVRGVPVIASRKGGFGETVEEGVSGLLFPNGDEEALTVRMLEVARRSAFPDHAIPDSTVSPDL